MRIGLIDVDGHNFPNLALMKIAAFHKKQGDTVEWVNYFERYDKVYASKVFTFTPDICSVIQADEIERGGTGYDIHKKLPDEIESQNPDYSIYPKFKPAYGFLTRGCIRNCHWCIVPKKEGAIKLYMDIEDVLQDRKSAILMDNNILAAGEYGLQQLEKIARIGCRIDFNQGLDCRLVTDEIAFLLSKIKWIRYIRFALDTESGIDSLLSAIEKLKSYGITESKIFVYVLLSDFKSSYNRLNIIKQIGVNPFAQPYMDFTARQIIPQWQRDMARWCNNKAILASCDFKDYKPRKGFYCREYFND